MYCQPTNQRGYGQSTCGVCSARQSRPKLYMQLKRLGYRWPNMICYCREFARRCQVCQYHGKFTEVPPESLHATTHLWPIPSWRIDIMGPFEKDTVHEYKHILASMDYFSKWAEAIIVQDFTILTVVEFLRNHIIYTDSLSLNQHERQWPVV